MLGHIYRVCEIPKFLSGFISATEIHDKEFCLEIVVKNLRKALSRARRFKQNIREYSHDIFAAIFHHNIFLKI